MNDARATILQTKNLHKSYQESSQKNKQAQNALIILNNINFSVKEQDRIAIVGASGSGKSTFMHLLSGLDTPTQGEVWIKNQNLNLASEAKKGILRNQHLGFIYQFHHLLPEFTALDNVAIPLMIRGESVKEAHNRAQQMLDRVGLRERMTHKPSELSGGERQRVAIARALVTKPSAVLADEPTGNLDDENALIIFNLMLEINQEVGTALVMVTHDRELAAKMDQVWRIKDRNLIREL